MDLDEVFWIWHLQPEFSSILAGAESKGPKLFLELWVLDSLEFKWEFKSWNWKECLVWDSVRFTYEKPPISSLGLSGL